MWRQWNLRAGLWQLKKPHKTRKRIDLGEKGGLIFDVVIVLLQLVTVQSADYQLYWLVWDQVGSNVKRNQKKNLSIMKLWFFFFVGGELLFKFKMHVLFLLFSEQLRDLKRI